MLSIIEIYHQYKKHVFDIGDIRFYLVKMPPTTVKNRRYDKHAICLLDTPLETAICYQAENFKFQRNLSSQD